MVKNLISLAIFGGVLLAGSLWLERSAAGAVWTSQEAFSLFAQETSQSIHVKAGQLGDSGKTVESSLLSRVALDQTVAWSPIQSLTFSESVERDQTFAGQERLKSGRFVLAYKKTSQRSRTEFSLGMQVSHVVDPSATSLAVQSELSLATASAVWLRSQSASALYEWKLSPSQGLVSKLEGSRATDQLQTRRAIGLSIEGYQALDPLTIFRLMSGYKIDLDPNGYEATSLLGTFNRMMTRQWQGTASIGVDHIKPNNVDSLPTPQTPEATATTQTLQTQQQDASTSLQGLLEASGQFGPQTLVLSARRGLQRRPVTDTLILADSLTGTWTVASRDRTETLTLAANAVMESDLLEVESEASPSDQTLTSLLAEYGRALFSQRVDDRAVFVDRISLGLRLEDFSSKVQTTNRRVALLGYLIQF